ncbi:MAG TPA: hypothetical protein DIT49_02500 [Clostridiales bacterium]|nr:hypothetical protein [Clostridiales bacterium]
MHWSEEALQEAHRQIASTIHKLHGVVHTLEQKEQPQRYRAQITLAQRRIAAFTLADQLIQRELAGAAAPPSQQSPTFGKESST